MSGTERIVTALLDFQYSDAEGAEPDTYTSGIILPYHPAPDDEDDSPKWLSEALEELAQRGYRRINMPQDPLETIKDLYSLKLTHSQQREFSDWRMAFHLRLEYARKEERDARANTGHTDATPV